MSTEQTAGPRPVTTVIRIRETDQVATATADVAAGERVSVTGVQPRSEVTALEPIPMGHKIALVDIATGAAIRKYGEVIGLATADIRAGAHVHVHNCRGRRARRFAGQ